VKDFASDEGRLFEMKDGVDDVLRIANPSYGLQAGEECVRLGRMHGCPDDTR
jgi:hypothetical protein